MAKPKKTAAPQRDFILIDRSGSMASRWNDTVGGVNAYVRRLAESKATREVLVTVACFDSTEPFTLLRSDMQAMNWRDIGNGEAYPRGGTPLYDAVGRLTSLAFDQAPEKAAIVIVTDGQENASLEHTKDSAKALLDQCRAKGWQVIFLGADFDNTIQAADLGNAAASTMTLSSHNSASVFHMTAAKRGLYGVTGQAMSYSADEKAAAVSPKA